MHDTALLSGQLFALAYGGHGKTVIDVGGKNINGSLKDFFIQHGMKYISVDLEPDPSVDIVIQPGQKLPFDDQSVDLVVSTSCFEHDPLFWMTFKDMCRITKLNGYIYINAPANGPYHAHPADNWRFYSDAAQSLAYWSGIQISQETVFPVQVVETFHILPIQNIWIDFVSIWKRVTLPETQITLSNHIITHTGPLQTLLQTLHVSISKKPVT